MINKTTHSCCINWILPAVVFEFFHQRFSDKNFLKILVVAFKIIRTVGGSDTTVYTPATNYEYYLYDSTANTTEDVRLDRFPIFVVDTPSTTSACTYKVQYRSMRTDNNNLASMQHGSNFSMGFLMEIAQ